MTMYEKYEQIIITLVRDSGVRGKILAVEQFSWMLFLKLLDIQKVQSAKIDSANLGRIRKKFRWSGWACPKLKNGKPDSVRTKNGDELVQFVDDELFPHLREISKLEATKKGADPESLEYKIWNVFGYLRNRVNSGKILREVLDFIDSIDFSSDDQVAKFAKAFEDWFTSISKTRGQANQYFTPRTLVRAIVNVVAPKTGETIYDGAAGTCGFLIESLNFLQPGEKQLTDDQQNFIKTQTFFGRERAPAVYLFGLLNSILHGIKAPNLYRVNVLELNNRKKSGLKKFDIVLANIPFNQEASEEEQKNFEIKYGTTEVLYLQHIMNSVKPNGRAAVVVPDFMLEKCLGPHTQLRMELLNKFDLHTILSLPRGMFMPYLNVKTSVLFFDRVGKTSNIWYYELNPEQRILNNDKISDQDFEDFVDLFSRRETTDNSWMVPVKQFEGDYNLVSQNPRCKKKADKLAAIAADEILQKTKEVAKQALANAHEILVDYLDEWFGAIKTHKVIGEFVEIKKGMKLPKDVKLNDDFVKNYPYLRLDDISDYGNFDFAKIKSVSREAYNELNQNTISIYDLLICVAGKIGTTVTVPEEVHGAAMSEDLARLSIKDNGALDRNFLYLYTLTGEFQQQARNSTRIEAREEIWVPYFNKIEIPFCPIAKQQELITQILPKVEQIKEEEYVINSDAGNFREELLNTIGYLSKISESIRHLLKRHDAGKLNSPHSFGGNGAYFESHVQAYFLTLMLAGGQTPCLPKGEIRRIKLKGMPNGNKTADSAVVFQETENQERRKLFVQICHSTAFTESYADFSKVVRDAWHVFKYSDNFIRGKDAIALIVRQADANGQKDVQWLLNIAKSAKNSVEFFQWTEDSNFSPAKSGKKLDTIKIHLSESNFGKEVPSKEIFEFIKHLHLLELDFDDETGIIMTLIHSLISQFEGHSKSPADIWHRLVEFVHSQNKTASAITLDDLPADLFEIFSTRKQKTVQVENSLSNSVSDSNLLKPSDTEKLALLSLLGSWDTENACDRRLVATILNLDNEGRLEEFKEFFDRYRSAIYRANGVWRVNQKVDQLRQIGAKIASESLNRFAKLALNILSENENRSGKQQNVYACSTALRQGVTEGLAILGNFPEFFTSAKSSKLKDMPHSTVRKILTSLNWQQGTHLDELLPNLAAAAPTEFLTRLDKEINSKSAIFGVNADEIQYIATEDGSLVRGLRCSLEALARDCKYLKRIGIWMGKFGGHARRRGGIGWLIASLDNVFRYHLSQENVKFAELKDSLDAILATNNELGWKLLLKLLPMPSRRGFSLYESKWLKDPYKNNSVPKSGTGYMKLMEHIANRAVDEIGNDSKRLAELVKQLVSLPQTAMANLADKLTGFDFQFDSDAEQRAVWNNLNKWIIKQTEDTNTDWALPKGVLNKLAKVAKKIAPAEPLLRYQDLFSDGALKIAGNGRSLQEQFAEQSAILQQKRDDAVKEIFDRHGIDAILQLVKTVAEPRYVGYSLASMNCDAVDKQLQPEHLMATDYKIEEFVAAYVKECHNHKGWKWVDSVRETAWTTKQTAKLLLYLPFEKGVWERVEAWLNDSEDEYWKNTEAWSEESEHLEIAVGKLLKCGRPSISIDCLGRMLKDGREIDSGLCVTALMSNLSSNEEHHGIDVYLTLDLIEYLQKNPNVDEDKLFEVEWAYLSLYQHRNSSRPKTVERRLANDPEFFCEVIQIVYRSDLESESLQHFSGSDKMLMNGMHQLLRDWRELPGKDNNGELDAKKFKKWLQRVKEICTESGHLRSALSVIGNILVYAPGDKDGLWIDRAIASVLNDKDIAEMRFGYSSALASSQNGNGMHLNGRSDEAIAIDLQQRADSIEGEGFLILAESLRETAANQEGIATQFD